MPHDKNGNVVAAGDKVSVELGVIEVSTGEKFCNVRVGTTEALPDGHVSANLWLNAGQVEKVEPAAAGAATDVSASAIPPGTLPLVIGIITGIAELLKLFRNRTAVALLALLLLSADATAGPLCQRLRDRIAARRGCSGAQVAAPVPFRAAPAAPTPSPVIYRTQPADCPTGVCPLVAPARR